MDRNKTGVTERGNSFQFDFYYECQRIRATFPLSPKKKAHWITAENKMAAIKHEIALGTFNLAKHFPNHPKAQQYRKGSDIYIKDQLNNWIKCSQERYERTTLRGYLVAIDHHLIPSFGHLTLNELTSTHIRNWISNTEASNHTKNNILIPLRAIFADAYAEEIIEKNPMSRIRQLPRRSAEPDPFTREEMEKILNACDGQIQNIFKFAFWTGVRISELIALTWNDVNINKKSAFIRNVRNRSGTKDHPKTSESIRKIELLQPAIEALKQQKPYTYENGGDIFNNPLTDEPWPFDEALRKSGWMKVIKAANVPYRKPSNTRHTFASLMLSNDVNPMLVANQLGHTDWGMIRKIYGRWIPDADTTISDKVSYLWAQDGHKDVSSV